MTTSVVSNEKQDTDEDDGGGDSRRRPSRLQRRSNGPSKAYKQARGGGILSHLLALVGVSTALRTRQHAHLGQVGLAKGLSWCT